MPGSITVGELKVILNQLTNNELVEVGRIHTALVASFKTKKENVSSLVWAMRQKNQEVLAKLLQEVKEIQIRRTQLAESKKAALKTQAKLDFDDLYKQAATAGLQAGMGHTPQPMMVVGHIDPLDDSSQVDTAYYVPSGVCGFAWVKIRPANSPFAHWLKDRSIGSLDTYAGGWMIWVREFGQSYERKKAYAQAFAKVLQEVGIDAYSDGRLD